MRQIIVTVTAIALGLMLAGCAGMSDTEQRTLSGAGIGAVGGGIVGAIGGNTGLGIVLGTAAGAGGGYLYDQHKKSEERAYNTGYAAGKKSKNR